MWQKLANRLESLSSGWTILLAVVHGIMLYALVGAGRSAFRRDRT